MAKIQTKAFTQVRPIPLPKDGRVCEVAIDVEFPTAALLVGDLIELCQLPAGTRCIGWSLVFPKIDSNGSPALAFSLGVENAGGTDIGTEVWGTGLTAGQSTSVVTTSSTAADQGDVTSDRNIVLKVTTAAATWAGASKVGRVRLALVG